MPWDKRFDEDEVLDAATTFFWERGFKGVSMADLVGELGVNRSSLYDTDFHRANVGAHSRTSGP